MIQLDIKAIPNQSFNIQIENITYEIKIKQGKNAVLIDISQNETPLILGRMLTPFTPLIPYQYLTNGGNFYFETQNNELADYLKFGLSQFLYFVFDKELQNDR